MNKFKWQALLLIILTFATAAGLTFFAINEKREVYEDSIKMAIALVNEDDGVEFNDERYTIGNDFANSIINDTNHDWYVVSRGVADSGFEKQTYDMVIIIPNNFSQQSLNIDDFTPEQVRLLYKINATGHEEVRIEAEKVAEKILNDFNRRLVDIYFASIIGNLHDAQVNVTDIIEKEELYTDLYVNNIHSPLAGYTDQFQSIQDVTDLSKQNYLNLDDVFGKVEESLASQMDLNESYLTEINETIERKQEHISVAEQFEAQLTAQANSQNGDEHLNLLSKLKDANQSIFTKLQNRGNEAGEIINQSDSLKQYITQLDQDIADYNDSLHERIDENIDELIASVVEEITESQENVRVADLLDDGVEKRIKEEMDDLIVSLPTLSFKQINQEELPKKLSREIKDTIAFTRQYIKENNLKIDSNDDNFSKLLSTKVTDFKESLYDEGVEIEESIKVDSYNGEERFFYINQIPEYFYIDLMRLEWNGIQIPTNEFLESGKITLPSSDADEPDRINLLMKLKLQSVDSDLDIFSPIKWQWKLSQNGTEEIIEGESTLTDEAKKETNDSNKQKVNKAQKNNQQAKANDDEKEDSSETNPTDENTNVEENEIDEDINDNENETTEDNQTEDSDTNEDEEVDQEENPDESEIENENSGSNDNDNDNEDEDSNDNGETNPPNTDDKPQTVIKSESIIEKESYQLLVSNSQRFLINSIHELTKEYYELGSLLKMYYGFNWNDKLVQAGLTEGKKLAELSTEDSLYYFFNEQNIATSIENYFKNNFKNSIVAEIEETLALGELDEKISEYRDLLTSSDENAEQLVSTIAESSADATELNNHIAELLEELTNWRESMNKISNEQVTILSNDEEMQTMIVNLDSSFQPLLSSSQLLTEQVNATSSTAETAFDSLDKIVEEANTIQQSSDAVVVDAQDLAEKLITKKEEDVIFKNNFNDVLANSKVGDRPNDHLYQFLSNPVEIKNDALIQERESFVTYFLVLIMSITALFTAYALTTLQPIKVKEEAFDGKVPIYKKNMLLTTIVTAVGVIEGLLIGVISAYLLKIAHPVVWVIMLALTMLTFVLIATYLLRQLKMVGMFIILVVLSIYLFITRTLGFRFEHHDFVRTLRDISPLQHSESFIDTLLNSYTGFSSIAAGSVIVLVLILIGFALNLFVTSNKGPEEELDETDAESTV